MTAAPVANPAIPCVEIYSDADLIAVDKPAGLVTQPGAGHPNDSLLNGLFARERATLARLGSHRDWGLLHRLDRETSGVILVARNEQAYDHIRGQFEDRTIEKTYLAIVRGRLPHKEGTCTQPLAEVRRGDMKISVPSSRGETAITHWRVLASSKELAFVACSIETVKLHQIRAHMALLGAPLEGDRVYRSLLPPNTSTPPASQRNLPPTLRLHSWRIRLTQPTTGQALGIEAPLPLPMQELISQCLHGKDAKGSPSLTKIEAIIGDARSSRWWVKGKP